MSYYISDTMSISSDPFVPSASAPRRTGVIRLDERVGEDGYPRYEEIPGSMVLL